MPANFDFKAGSSSQPIAITTSGANYASGDVIGGIIELTYVNLESGRPVALRSLTLRDKNGNAIAMEIYFFKATPTGGTYTDNGAIAWGSGDAANCVGTLAVAAADWLTSNSMSFVNYSGLGMKMPITGTSLFAIILAKGAATLTDGNFTLDGQFDQN